MNVLARGLAKLWREPCRPSPQASLPSLVLSAGLPAHPPQQQECVLTVSLYRADWRVGRPVGSPQVSLMFLGHQEWRPSPHNTQPGGSHAPG